jgi:hypothetical protein
MEKSIKYIRMPIVEPDPIIKQIKNFRYIPGKKNPVAGTYDSENS